MNKILVNTNPVAFQRVIVVENDIVIDQVGVRIEDLFETIYTCAKKYNISEINFLGQREYALGLMRDAQNNTQFSEGLKFKYYGG